MKGKFVSAILFLLILLCAVVSAEEDNPSYTVAEQLTEIFPGIEDISICTLATDSDGLLNQEGGYSAKVLWTDTDTGVTCALEYFESESLAQERIAALEEGEAVRISQYVLKLDGALGEERTEEYLIALRTVIGVNYLANTNTMRFHLPDCFADELMNDSNRIDYMGTREELIEQGYEPCERCFP